MSKGAAVASIGATVREEREFPAQPSAVLGQDLIGNSAMQGRSSGGGENAMGSALLVGSTDDSSVAYDGRFTPELLKRLADDRGSPVSDVLTEIAQADVEDQNVQGFQVGGGDGVGDSVAVAIGNDRYENAFSPLFSCVKEANGMASELQTRGFDAKAHKNQRGNNMESLFSDVLSNAKERDTVVLHYSGHGTEEGIYGVGAPGENTAIEDDLVSHGGLISMATKAASVGVHVRLVLDACYSGALLEETKERVLDGVGLTAQLVSPETRRVLQQLNQIRGEFRQFPELLREHSSWFAEESDVEQEEGGVTRGNQSTASKGHKRIGLSTQGDEAPFEKSAMARETFEKWHEELGDEVAAITDWRESQHLVTKLEGSLTAHAKDWDEQNRTAVEDALQDLLLEASRQ